MAPELRRSKRIPEQAAVNEPNGMRVATLPPPRRGKSKKHKLKQASTSNDGNTAKGQPPSKRAKTSKDATKKAPVPEMLTISKDYIAQLPLIYWEGTVRVLNTAAEMMEAVQEILLSGCTHLGMDTETKPVYQRGSYNRPALIQLATECTVYLFRICKLPNHSFAPLLPLLTNPSILKTGSAIHGDVNELQRVQRFRAAGFVDCAHVTFRQLRIGNTGLRALAAHENCVCLKALLTPSATEKWTKPFPRRPTGQCVSTIESGASQEWRRCTSHSSEPLGIQV